MEGIIFMGIQASGKSSFYKEFFSDTHIRITLDMLKTRNREKILVNACIEAKQPFVIDNTNPTIDDRQNYIQKLKESEFKVIGYYFSSNINESKKRNELRTGNQRIPTAGILNTYNKLQLPSYDEGFDELYFVTINEENKLVVKDWIDEI